MKRGFFYIPENREKTEALFKAHAENVINAGGEVRMIDYIYTVKLAEAIINNEYPTYDNKEE